MTSFHFVNILVVLASTISFTTAWDNDQLELFDLIEEINQNFYELLNVNENAETREIKKAYRNLSLELHPDHNKAEDADVKFRQLVAVYGVLKNTEKRTMYNSVLRDGLPDWRQPVYYYRKARKLGLIEMCVLLFVIFTIGHYFVIWAVYLERKFEMEEVLFSQMKRKYEKEMKKKRDKNSGVDKLAEGVSEMVTDMLEAPTLHRLLPVQFVFAMKGFIQHLPEHCQSFKHLVKEQWEIFYLRFIQKPKEKQESDDEHSEDEDEEKKRPRRKRVDVSLPEYSTSHPRADLISNTKIPISDTPASNTNLASRANAEWTEEELSKLSKAMAKFPSGTLNRWEKVAEFMERTVNEITAKHKELRDAQYSHVNQMAVPETPEERVKKNKKSAQAMAALTSDVTVRHEVIEKTSEQPNEKVPANTDDSGWSQNQQKILEWAIAQFPKGTPERWDKIAEHIPGKTKSDCVQRFKFIVESLKQKKESS